MSNRSKELSRDELWKILVETVHALPMYKNHRRYVADVMLKERPDISSQELAVQLNIPLGEAIVLLEEVRVGEAKANLAGVVPASSKISDRSLLDFTE